MASVSQPPEVLPRLKRDTVRKLIEQGVRADGRGIDQYRALGVRVGFVKTADGSALVTLGGTKVMAGVKLEVGKPFEDTPDEGNLIVNLEIPPIASSAVEPGPPDENAIEVARVVDRAIRHSGFINMKALAINPGKQVWTMWVDVYVLNHDGNLIDASCMAASAALANAKLPTVELGTDGSVARVDRSLVREMPVDLNKVPITVTFAKLGNSIVLDPTLEEEALADGIFTIGISGGRVVAIQKVTGAFSPMEIKAMIERALRHYGKVKEALLAALGNPTTEFRI